MQKAGLAGCTRGEAGRRQALHITPAGYTLDAAGRRKAEPAGLGGWARDASGRRKAERFAAWREPDLIFLAY